MRYRPSVAFRRPLRFYVVDSRGVSRRYLSVVPLNRDDLREGDRAGDDDDSVVVSGPWEIRGDAERDREGRESVVEVMGT